MSWILGLLSVLLIGALPTWRLPFLADRLWFRVLRTFGLAMLFGPGAASIGYFLLLWAGIGSVPTTWILILMFIGIAGAISRFVEPRAEGVTATNQRFPFTWLLTAIFAIGLVVFAMDFSTATAASPNGEWDASAIWNLRARFLAAGPELWRRAIAFVPGSFMAEGSHPAYPLFLSSFVALLWNVNGSTGSEVPATVSILIALSTLALLVTGIARKSVALGVIAGCLLLGTELFAWQVPFQYSDLLQALCFLAALVLLDEAESSAMIAAAGFAIGLAPWIKNEGQPFAMAALVAGVWRFRGKATWLILGAFPGLLATVVLKLTTAGVEPMFPPFGQAISKLVDVSRWGQSIAGFARAIAVAGPWWAHPMLLAVAMAFALGFVPKSRRTWLAIPLAATFAAELGVYLVTTSDLTWQISTSSTRLVMQLWPSALWLLFTSLRPPEELFPIPSSPAEKPGKVKRKPR